MSLGIERAVRAQKNQIKVEITAIKATTRVNVAADTDTIVFIISPRLHP